MARDQKLQKLQAWAALHAKTEAIDEQIEAIFGTQADTPFSLGLWTPFDAYQREIAEQIGDDASWLDWYRFDCEMGNKAMEAVSWAGKSIKVSTLRQLLTVITWGKSNG